MITIADIMTSPVITLTPHDTLRTAHDTTRTQGIRHLPVVDSDTGMLMGIVTQRSMIAKVISLMNLYGVKNIDAYEEQTSIMEIAVIDFDTISPTESVSDVAPFFLNNKHGCLPVIGEDGKLSGIVTSSDFVKLSVSLLEQLEL
ncbi:HPP family protein [Alteromonas sp. H39]|uniref:CBS domain-containing protein n=1 Tax=Alteromonas sp. H39 TaxID=3389876 RepID=UPI0039E0AFC2